MTTLEHTWRERRGGKATRIANKEMDYTIENPFVGVKFQRFIDALAEDDCPEDRAFYALAYIVEEYEDEIADALADADADELRETVVDIEDEIAAERARGLDGQPFNI